MRPRILVVTPTLLPTIGGAEIGIDEIFSRVAEHNDVLVLAPYPPGRRGHAETDRADSTRNYAVVRYGSRASRLPAPLRRIVVLSNFPLAMALLSLRRKFEPSVVNIHFIFPLGPAVTLFARRAGIPLVISLVGRRDVLGNLSKPARTLSRAVLRQSDGIIANSALYLRDEHISASIIPYGCNDELFTQVPSTLHGDPGRRHDYADQSFRMVSLQRLVSVKRVHLQLDVVDALRNRGISVHLTILGDGACRAILEQEARQRNLTDLVSIAGYATDEQVTTELASSDLFIFTSAYETFGVVFAQAMAMGLPIVAFDNSCVGYVVQSGLNGELVQDGDINAMADAVQRLASDIGRRRMMAETNRQHAEANFRWSKISSDYTEVLATVKRRPAGIRLRRSQAGEAVPGSR